jgi:uncharacterized membrane protein YraQ (UPF0718 family)
MTTSACTVIPVINGTLLSSVPLALVISFWIASPTMDPEKFALTAMSAVWGVVTRRVFALYLGVSLVGAMVLGLLTNLLLG